MSLGTHVSACIDSSGMIWTWGQNLEGELGVEDNEPRDKPFPVMALKTKHVSSVTCGPNFYFAIGKEIKANKILGLNKSKGFVNSSYSRFYFDDQSFRDEFYE